MLGVVIQTENEAGLLLFSTLVPQYEDCESQSLFPRDPEGLSKGQLRPTLLNDSENPHCPEAKESLLILQPWATHSFKISLRVTFVTLQPPLVSF